MTYGEALFIHFIPYPAVRHASVNWHFFLSLPHAVNLTRVLYDLRTGAGRPENILTNFYLGAVGLTLVYSRFFPHPRIAVHVNPRDKKTRNEH